VHRLPADQRAEEQTVSSPRTLRIQSWLIGGLSLLADRLTKQLVMARFHPGQSLPFFPPLLRLTYVQNTGAAFGVLRGQQFLFIVISVVVIGWVSRELLTRPPTEPRIAWAYGLILGGAVGNLIDRLRLGYVVDFIDLRVWPVFNVGDSAITVGVALLLWEAMRRR